MARTIIEIRDEILAAKAAQPDLDVLNSTSNVALYKLWIWITATCIWTLEKLHDIFKLEVEDTISKKNPHTPEWYVEKAKAFQYGYALVPEKDYYDNTGIADDVVEASKIVKFAAMPEDPFLRLKVAKLVGLNLAKLDAAELIAFKAYVKRYKGAGVKLNDTTITSGDPDNLRVVLRVKFNPLVLNSTGARLDGTSATPVPDAMKSYLYNIDFNGLFSTQKLEAFILAVDGVEDVKIDSIQRKYGALPYTSVDIDFVPDSGYLIINDVDLIPTYIPA
jgi:hypothetical protein